MDISYPQTSNTYSNYHVSLFPTAGAEFKLLRLILSQRKFAIELMMKHDSSKGCRNQFNKTFDKKKIVELKETVRQVVSNFRCDNVRRDATS